MPILILHSDADPIELVVEVLVSVIYPGPDLLLYIARTLISWTTSEVCDRRRRRPLQSSSRGESPHKAADAIKGGLQEASREHQIWRDENVVKEVETYYLRSQYHGKSGSETVVHTLHAKLRGAANLADDNLSFERPEDNKAELDFT